MPGYTRATQKNRPLVIHHGSYSSGCSSFDGINAVTNEIDWGANNLRWALMQTCRFLSMTDNSGNYNSIKHNHLKDMFKGMRFIMGYQSRMYMHSHEGTYLGQRISAGDNIADSFFLAVREYQAYNGYLQEPIYPTVMGLRTAMNNDTRYTGVSRAPLWNDADFTVRYMFVPSY